MTSKFTEILEPSQAPTYSHPHLNVSLEDVLAEEGRKRSSSSSSSSSQSSTPRSGSDSPKSPTEETKASMFRRRAFTLGSKKGRHVSWMASNLSEAETKPTADESRYHDQALEVIEARIDCHHHHYAPSPSGESSRWLSHRRTPSTTKSNSSIDTELWAHICSVLPHYYYHHKIKF